MSDPSDAVEALLYRYAAAIDAGDFEAVGALFAHGAIATEDGSVIARGADEVRRLYESTTRRHDDGTPRTAHVTSNVQVTVDDGGEQARARSVFVVLQAVPASDGDPGLGLQPVIAGRYDDTLVRRDVAPAAGSGSLGEWWFAERRMRPELFGDLSHHLLFDPATLG